MILVNDDVLATHITNKGSWSAGAGEADRSIFSPDGRFIAFNRIREDLSYDLRVIAAHEPGAKPRIVYSNPEFRYIEPDGWSPDGEILVMIVRQDWTSIFGFVSVETGELRVLKTHRGHRRSPWLSPDGRWVAYDPPSALHTPNRDIFLLAADGSRETLITDHQANDFVLGFSPDGGTLLFASDRTGSYGLWGVRISHEGLAGEPRLVQRDIGSITPLGVTKDGTLYYAKALGSIDIYTVQIDLMTGRLLSKPALISGLSRDYVSRFDLAAAAFADPGKSPSIWTRTNLPRSTITSQIACRNSITCTMNKKI